MRDHARGPAAARGALRGDAGAAADRAVRRRAVAPTSPSTATTSAPAGSSCSTTRAGNDAWDGTFRCVAYARAEIDLELITDPMLAAVGWSWLTEALDAHGAAYAAASGTVTRVATESFGGDGRRRRARAQIEIRASWTPVQVGRRRASTSRRTSRPGASCSARPSAAAGPRGRDRDARAAAASAAPGR